MPTYAAEPYTPTEYDPPLTEVLQEEYPVVALPVHPTGPTTTHELPSRCGAAETRTLTVGTFVEILGQDLRRKRTILLADQDWQYARKASDTHGVYWPARVPLVLQHGDSIYAAASTNAGNLTVITETWAD